MADDALDPLLDQLKAAAEAFSDDDEGVAKILATMAADVQRARSSILPIFPVIHHSPASAVHMVRYLRERAPRLVFIELCEDLRGLVGLLQNCTLPVALQAFAGEIQGFPLEWSPLSVVAPITEFSAEYQAIAYALQDPEVELIFVDRSVDHVFQWSDRDDPELPEDDPDEEEDEEDRLHGAAVGIQIGDVVPTFADFRDFLLQNARMSRFEEWVDLYIEEPTIGANTATYREILFLVGSLFRRLGSTAHSREAIRRRDRYMWTRIKEAMAEREVPPERAVFICGAAHTVDDDCPEFGLESDARLEISAPSGTRWLYGFIPSSYGAIEHQFGHARGTVALAETRWRKALETWNLQPFTLKGAGKAPGRIKKAKPPVQLSLEMVLSQAPHLADADAEELLGWCIGIVASARKNRYLASTADAIAIYETSILLARIRSRRRPSPHDFIDAAEACLEKGRPPGRRDVRQLCSKMLGGDRVGQVGYASSPPLVQDIYDRLAILRITAKTRKNTRVLLDFSSEPEKREASKLLWRLNWLIPGSQVAHPIMGELKLGMSPRQESWDVKLHGAAQAAVMQLSFEGVTVEQVLERRLSESAFGADARTVTALHAVEVSLMLLDSPRMTATLGRRSVALLTHEIGAKDAPEIFDRIQRLVHHYRATTGTPEWLSDFVATGYQHYSTQMPEGFGDRGTSPEELAATLSFVFTLESLALTMGCSRSQLVIAIEHASTTAAEPEKLGLLWAAEWLVQLKDEDAVRRSFFQILDHPLGRSAFPRYLSGFLQALGFAPRIAPLGVELLGRAFGELPDAVLLPWIPSLLSELRPRIHDVLPTLFTEVARTLPPDLSQLDTWEAPWAHPIPTAAPGPDEPGGAEGVSPAGAGPAPQPAQAAAALLAAQPATLDSLAVLLGVPASWPEPSRAPGGPAVGGAVAPSAPTTGGGRGAAAALLAAHPATLQAVCALLAG
ncbi:MAG TPA: hypothetical protein ENK18_27025 [Deltaproteobacteria bacterium]|nr:hypothetical protein [Deltaproteobacteria bacterium]